MKKSKIIVPALAIIAFSTAASITGTVAWFTATRSVTVDAGSYAVVKTNADLKCVVDAGIGTTKSNDTKISVGTNKLTDASFDHYKANETDTLNNIYVPADDGQSIAKAIALDAATDNDDASTGLVRSTLTSGVKVYSAVTWTMTFTVSFGAVSGDYGLFLDANTTSFTTSGTATTAKGFRMAFVPTTVPTGSEGVTKVLAKLQTSANCKYVSGLSDYTGTAYANNTLIDSEFDKTASTLPADGAKKQTEVNGAAGRNDYLGMFKYAESTNVSITYKVVAWFEGTDTEIRNRESSTDYQSVAASLTFKAIKLKDASAS